VFWVIYTMDSLTCAKRFFKDFILVVTARFGLDSSGYCVPESVDVAFIPFEGIHCRIIGRIEAPADSPCDGSREGRRGREFLARLIKAVLALSEYQLAFPQQWIVDSVAQAGSEDPPTLGAGDPSNQVTLQLDPEKLASDLRRLLFKGVYKNYVRVCRETDPFKCAPLRRIVRAGEIFASAVSQADYVSFVFLLAVAVEVAATALKAYCELVGNRKVCDLKAVRRKLVEDGSLYIEHGSARYSLLDLRNAIAHGEASLSGSSKLSFEEAERIISESIHVIEREIAVRVRQILRRIILGDYNCDEIADLAVCDRGEQRCRCY